MTVDLVVTGSLVLPDRIQHGGWLSVSGGIIQEIGTGTPPLSDQKFNAENTLVFPGVIDGQTHATSFGGMPGIESTTRSAVAGGVTTIVDMPYDNPRPMSSIETFEVKRDAVNALAHCDVALYATVLPDQGLDQIAPLTDAGVAAFKISSFESSPTRFPRIPLNMALDVLEALAKTDLPLGLHNEDQEIVAARIAKMRTEGCDGISAHSDSRPLAAELSSTAAFLALGEAAGAHAHLVHLSTASGFRLVHQAADAGVRATGELCVHYLWFDPDVDGPELGARMKVNPPIRPGQTSALWREVKKGTVAFVSSDHSSWPLENKQAASIFDAGAGVPGVETLLPAFQTLAGKKGVDGARLTATMLSERPAKFFGLWPRKGALMPGADADIAVYETRDATWDAQVAHDDLCWSPFDGRSFNGAVMRTYLRGQLAWDGKIVTARPGDGRFVARAGVQ